MRCGDAGHGDAFLAAAIAADDPNRTLVDVEGIGEECDQGVVGRAFNGWGRHAHDERVVASTGIFGFSGARDDADVDFDARVRLTNQGRPCARRGCCASVSSTTVKRGRC